MSEFKVCTRCKLVKHLSEFHKYSKSKDGLKSWCKSCCKEYKIENKERLRIKNFEYNHSEQGKQSQDKYKNTEKYKEKNRRYNRSEVGIYHNKRYKRSKKGRALDKKIKQKYPKRVHARHLLNYAIRIGKIHKPILCEICDREKRLEGHHEDYNFPLRVVWVCKQCHIDIHKLGLENINVSQ